MDLYIVKARATRGGYSESVEILTQMEEKKQTFVGNRQKINKNHIDVVREGSFIGSFQVIVRKEEEIPEARIRLRDEVIRYNLDKFQEYQYAMNAAIEHNLGSSIRVKKD